MPAPASAFRKIELLIALLAFPLLTAGCGPKVVWGIPADDLMGRFAKGNYDALAGVDFQTQDPDQALGISPQAPFYLSFLFDSLNRPEQAKRMLELAWNRSPQPWRDEAGLSLAQRLLDGQAYPRAGEIARTVIAGMGSADVKARAQRILVEALYWTKEDQATLDEAARLVNPDPEVLLFRAVSSLRLGRSDAHDLVLKLFIAQKVSPLHGRMYAFLQGSPTYLGIFSDVERNLILGKEDLLQGSWVPGITLLQAVMSTYPPARAEDSVLPLDMATAYMASGRTASGARFLESLIPRMQGQALMDSLEQAGRLYRRARDGARAMPLFRLLARTAFTSEQRDRARWYVLDLLLSQARPDLMSQIQSEAAQWGDPTYFTSLLDDTVSSLIQTRSWSALVGLWRALGDRAPPDVGARMAYVLGRAWEAGLFPRSVSLPAESARELFRQAVQRSPASYYGVLAASMLDEVPDSAVPADAVQKGQPPALDPLIAGFLPFGLTSQAYARFAAMKDALSDDSLLEASRAIAQAGDYRNAMYLMVALAGRRRLTVDELRQLYPQAFQSLIDEQSREAGIPIHVLYGLVREESYFDPDIVSSAGAVGLAQLMPATAAPVAASLHIDKPDLTDPATNLAIGARHLRALIGNAGSIPKALLSYNAGLARLRQWERAGGKLPLDLFVETVPIIETRGYVRKILVSSVMYALLYHDADPRQAALSFFELTPDVTSATPTPAAGAVMPR